MNRVRKNYGGRMIFGDEKLTPLRSVPSLSLGSANMRIYASSLRSSPFGTLPSATSYIRQPLGEMRAFDKYRSRTK